MPKIEIEVEAYGGFFFGIIKGIRIYLMFLIIWKFYKFVEKICVIWLLSRNDKQVFKQFFDLLKVLNKNKKYLCIYQVDSFYLLRTWLKIHLTITVFDYDNITYQQKFCGENNSGYIPFSLYHKCNDDLFVYNKSLILFGQIH